MDGNGETKLYIMDGNGERKMDQGEFSKREDNIQLWFKVLILVIMFMKVYCANKNDQNCTIK